MSNNLYTIDATNKTPGRLATEIARCLTGKNKATYVPYLDQGGEVLVKNVAAMKFTGRKLGQKTYKRHTLHLGHLKITKMDALFKKNPQAVLSRAVYSMLPETKHRRAMMARLKFE
jgi:large subunit ribosomal protein L13